jgi:hypothetical protein
MTHMCTLSAVTFARIGIDELCMFRMIDTQTTGGFSFATYISYPFCMSLTATFLRGLSPIHHCPATCDENITFVVFASSSSSILSLFTNYFRTQSLCTESFDPIHHLCGPDVLFTIPATAPRWHSLKTRHFLLGLHG